MAGSVDQESRRGAGCARICLVDSGQPALTAGIANVLVRQGFEVTLLSVDAHANSAVADYPLDEAVTGKQLTAPDGLFVQLPHAARLSYLAWLYLRDRDFDVIQFPAHRGVGYYTQLGRRQGLAFRDTTLLVRLACPEYWHLQQGEYLVDDVTVLDRMFMEQRSTELADVLVSGTEDILAWVHDQQWCVPEDSRVIVDFPETGRHRIEEAWLTLYQGLVAKGTQAAANSVASGSPLVSVCLVHFNRPRLLLFMLESLYRQDYNNFEVILVDDGSTLQEARDFIAALEPLFAERGWRIVRQRNAYLGAARNNAAAHATGEFLLFLDDDNVATPQLISTYVGVAQRTRADILTCATRVFDGDGAAPEAISMGTHWVPLGGSVASGLFRNVFGDASALVRKRVFDRLGGFSEDYGLGHEDWEFFARAVLGGYRLEVVPEPLLFYRVSATGMLLGGDTGASLARSLRPYLDAIPAELRPVLYLALGQEHSGKVAPAGLYSPSVLLGLARDFAASGGKRGMVKRFIRVVRSQGWSRAIKAVLRYGQQGR